MTKPALAFALAVLTGCGAVLSPDDSPNDPDASLSPLGHRVVEALYASHGSMRGRSWNVATENSFKPGWILQTPSPEYWGQPVSALPVARSCTGDAACDPDFGLIACSSQADCRFGGTCTTVAATVNRPGAAPRRLCTGHSDAFYDEIYGVITSARSFVDIASLDAPDGRFEAAVRNAVTYLSRGGGNVQVRVLYGAVPLRNEPTADVLASLVRDVDPASNLRVSVAAYRDNLEAWNHTKLIGADGQTAIVGGHNMWTQHYLQQAPVHDISMKISGGAAADASRFVNELWRHPCHPTPSLDGTASVSNFPATADICKEEFPVASATLTTGTATVVTVGKIGASEDSGEDGIIALVDAAQTQLRLSLQDIGPIGQGAAWPDNYLGALVAALGRGVDIQLVLSNLHALPGGLTGGSASYSNGWTPEDVIKHLADHAAAHPELVPAGTTMATLLCTHLHVTTLRQGADEVWTDGATFANHAKLVISDDAAFYLGSQNWYPALLSELGYIVDDVTATHELIEGYYAKLWAASRRVSSNTCGI